MDAEDAVQESHFQQLVYNGSKLAYLPVIMRLMTSARFSEYQNSEFS
jgi:hypothetical protein